MPVARSTAMNICKRGMIFLGKRYIFRTSQSSPVAIKVSPHLKDELAAEMPRLADAVGLGGLR